MVVQAGVGVDRFIPACAGNAPASIAGRAHRARRASGSSPHARGTPWTTRSSIFWPRFIPACAGNADPERLRAMSLSVHPRMRGERLAGFSGFSSSPGSSPHARGTRSRHRCRPPPAPVHPRMRGERTSQRTIAARHFGSSPHARGTRNRGVRIRCGNRFIPACAGNANLKVKE